MPKHVMCNMLVIVAEDVADTGHFWPRDLRVPLFEVRRKVAACLGNNFDAAFDQPAFALICLKCLKGDACHFAIDEIDCAGDVCQAEILQASGH